MWLLVWEQPISVNGWHYLLSQADPHRNFDGEIMAFGAMSGRDMDRMMQALISFGYVGPDQGDKSDMVLSDMFTGTDKLPSWIELVDVKFFDETQHPVQAWKKKQSNVYQLLNFEKSDELPMKGYECDWQPFIGKIN